MQAQTQYHELVLYKSRLHVINSVSQALTQEIVLTARSAAVGGGSINPLGFTADTASGTLYLFTGSRPCNSCTRGRLDMPAPPVLC